MKTSSFITVLNDIFNARKRHFDQNVKALVTAPYPHASIVFDDKASQEKDEFATLLGHFKAVKRAYLN
jgi:hypothetical protein